nr:MAG TPA: hypothetical protein [Caudoviricetes sp.]
MILILDLTTVITLKNKFHKNIENNTRYSFF